MSTARSGGAGASAEAALTKILRENPALARLLTPEHRTALERYWALLERWGAALNLSRRQGPEDWARADVADSVLGLQAAGVFEAEVRARALADGAFDVGSGGGFPGVVLALLWPDVPTRWVETSMRRVSFLKRVVRELGLSAVEVVHARVEELEAQAGFVTSRATFPWDRLGILEPRVAPGGRLCAFVGREPDEAAWRAQVERWGWESALVGYEVAGLGPRSIAVAVRRG